MIRHVGVGDLQQHFADSIDGTCVQHLQRGLFEAQARDEAGHGDAAGHKQMWFAARDIAFEHPVTEDETERMLDRMSIPRPGSAQASTPPEIAPLIANLDFGLEMMLRRMISLLFIEISAFHTFAWAEAVLSDDDLVAGDGGAAALVGCIRADETPHVDYLRTALTEMRDRTFAGTSGEKIAGTHVIDTLWDTLLADSLGPRRRALQQTTLREVEFALEGNARRDEILEGFHASGTVRPPFDREPVR
jgi:hypothetical protein